MKFLTNILLSSLCLTFSAAALANEGNISVEKCAQSEGFVSIPPVQTNKSYPGYTTKFYKDTRTDGINGTDRVVDCMETNLVETLKALKAEKMSKEEEDATFMKKVEEYEKTYRRDGNIIFDDKNKIAFDLTTTSEKRQSREELCEDYKGKYETYPNSNVKIDKYAYCMGTKVHKGPTCQNQYGDPCGTQYDKSSIGYTIK